MNNTNWTPGGQQQVVAEGLSRDTRVLQCRAQGLFFLVMVLQDVVRDSCKICNRKREMWMGGSMG